MSLDVGSNLHTWKAEIEEWSYIWGQHGLCSKNISDTKQIIYCIRHSKNRLELGRNDKKHDKVHSWRSKARATSKCVPFPRPSAWVWVWLNRVYQQTWVEWCDLLQVVFLELDDSDQSCWLLFEMLILPAYSLAQCVGPSEGAQTAGQSQQYRLWSLKDTFAFGANIAQRICVLVCVREILIFVFEK